MHGPSKNEIVLGLLATCGVEVFDDPPDYVRAVKPGRLLWTVVSGVPASASIAKVLETAAAVPDSPLAAEENTAHDHSAITVHFPKVSGTGCAGHRRARAVGVGHENGPRVF